VESVFDFWLQGAILDSIPEREFDIFWLCEAIFSECRQLLVKNRLISTHFQDSGPKYLDGLVGQMKIWLKIKTYSIKSVFVLFAIIVSIVAMSPAQPVYAGLFSFIFGGDEAEARSEPKRNSQNMALPQAALNPSFNLGRGGGDITIVSGSALLPEAGPIGTLAGINDGRSGQISIYVVRQGDTLSSIAKMFGVSVNTIIWANDISGPIRDGQRLIILPISGIQHTVVKTDTLKSIAKKYRGDLEEILQYNGLSETSALTVGQTIMIPDGEGAPAKTPTARSGLRGIGGPYYEGYYLKPILGSHKTQGLHGYNGVDFGALPGTPVMAAAPGYVIISRNSGWNGGYGNYVVIAHDNGTQTLYGHLLDTTVVEGQTVVRSHVIGYTGSTGLSTGPHLHFEIRGAVNPF